MHSMKLKAYFRTCLETKRGFSLEMILRISSLMKINSSLIYRSVSTSTNTSVKNKATIYDMHNAEPS